MGLMDIVQRIQEEANLESERLMATAKEEVRKLRETSKSELRSHLDELSQNLEKEKKTLWNMHISEGKRRSRHSLLSSKEELIQETISAIRIKLSEMRGSELASNLSFLIEHAKSALGPDLRVYPIRTIDADIIRGKVTMGEVLKGASDLPKVLTRFEDKDHIGGFVAVSSDGNKVLDMTFHGLIEKNEERIREEISRTLFVE